MLHNAYNFLSLVAIADECSGSNGTTSSLNLAILGYNAKTYLTYGASSLWSVVFLSPKEMSIRSMNMEDCCDVKVVARRYECISVTMVIAKSLIGAEFTFDLR